MRFSPLFALTLCACSAEAGHVAERLHWSRDTIDATLELLHDLTVPADSTHDLAYPLHARAARGVVFVADRATDRVAVLDTLGNVIRWIGSRGRGPGEILGIAHLATRRGHLLVAEALNGRVSEFTTGGRFVRTYSSPFAAGALAATHSVVVTAARSHTHYAARLQVAADQKPVLPRPRLPASLANVRWSRVPGHDLIAADSASVWTLDQGTGALCRFEHPSRAGSCRQLPETLLQRLRQYRDDRVATFERSTPLRVQAAPLVKDMVQFGTYLAMLLPLPDLPVVLVDIADGEVTPVSHRSDSLPAWVRRATSFAWDGRAFVLVSDDGIGRLRIARRPTLD
jgi:hypothetical protein